MARVLDMGLAAKGGTRGKCDEMREEPGHGADRAGHPWPALPGDTLPPLVAAVRAGKPGMDLRVLKVATPKLPHAEFGRGDALFKKK